MHPIDNLQILKASLFKRAKKICIVGNGGITDRDEQHIKEADLVIRFNNYATREGIQHPKIERCSVLFTTFDLHSAHQAPENVVIGIPFPFKAENILAKSHRWYPRASLWMVNPYWNHLMCKELGVLPNEELLSKHKIDTTGWKHPFPSIGTTCLWHLNRLGVFNAVSTYLCGFNWYFDWETQLCQGYKFGLPEYPKHHNHVYPKEVEWIIRKRININFSPACKKILDFARNELSINRPS